MGRPPPRPLAVETMHVAVKLAGTAIAGLNFINDEGGIGFPAEGISQLQEFGCQGVNTALALYAFHHNTCQLFGEDGLFQGFAVIGGNVDEAGCQGLKILMEMVLTGGSQSGQGSAMEAVHQRHDGIAVSALLLGGILSGNLDGTFIGLRTGIGEKHLLHTGSLAEHLRQHRTRLGIVQIGHMLQLL